MRDQPGRTLDTASDVAALPTLARPRDLLALTKPSIVAMCLVTTAGGIWLAPGALPLGRLLAVLVGTALGVGAANALNMYLEREIDGLMRRTRQRPLPDRRMAPPVALAFGLISGATSLVLLWTLVNPLTALLVALAIDTYVLLYTPLKRRSHLAIYVGAVPGAIPPLLGWTAVTGTINAPGLLLFLIMVLWQVPHFLAIAIYRKAEYAKAGFRVMPLARGDEATRRHARITTLMLLPISVMLVPLGVTGPIYFTGALLSGGWLIGLAFKQLKASRGPRGARRYFFGTLLYLPLLIVALIVDVVVR